MSILVKRVDYPQATTVDDVLPLGLDYRREILSNNLIGPQSSLQDRTVAMVANSVVALVGSDRIEKRENGTPQQFWEVKDGLITLKEHLDNKLTAHVQKVARDIALRAAKNMKVKPPKAQLLQLVNKMGQDLFTACTDLKTIGCAINDNIKDQIVLAQATGCLITGDRILTCGHLDEITGIELTDAENRLVNHPEKLLVLFGFRNGDIRPGSILPAWQVREVESFEMIPWSADEVTFSLTGDDRYDVAILKLKPLPHGVQSPVPELSIYATPPNASDPLYTIGCPNGIPLKYVQGTCLGQYQFSATTQSSTRFTTDMQSFGGGSGSPVFRRVDGGPAQICGVSTSVRTMAYPNLMRSIRQDAKTIIKKYTGGDGGLQDADFEVLYHSRNDNLLITDDRKSYTFDKLFSDDVVARNAFACSRTDALAFFLGSLGSFAPGTASASNYASVSILIAFADDVHQPVTLSINGRTSPNDPPNVIHATATSKTAQTGSPFIYFFADFAPKLRRLTADQVSVALKADLEERQMVRWMMDNGFSLEAESRWLDEGDARIWDEGWITLWANIWKARNAKTKGPLPNTPLVFGGWFDGDNAGLAAYSGFNGAPGLLGMVQEDSLWVSTSGDQPLPMAGKITVRYDRGTSSTADSKFTTESSFFQAVLVFEDHVRPGAENAGKIYGRVERWIGPLATVDHMLKSF